MVSDKIILQMIFFPLLHHILGPDLPVIPVDAQLFIQRSHMEACCCFGVFFLKK